MDRVNRPIAGPNTPLQDAPQPAEGLERTPLRRPPARADNYQTSQRAAGRPPVGQGFFDTLLHPLAPQRRRRRTVKEHARSLVGQALELIYQGKSAAGQEVLRQLITHVRSNPDLEFDHELARGGSPRLHPVEEILSVGDYDALLTIGYALKRDRYGKVFVEHSDGGGLYIGQGTESGEAPNTTVSASGHGVYVCNGHRTEGEWSNNQANGKVRVLSPEGTLRCYEGQVKDGKMHGKGRATFSDGRVLSGTWSNEVRDGQGVLTWPNGDRLMARWVDGVLAPNAILETGTGMRYEGQFNPETCRPEGHCTITWLEGDKAGAQYEGTIRDGLPSGNGVYTYGSDEELAGFAYEGPFFKGAKNGVGKFLELSTELRTRARFVNDILKTQPPERTDVDSDAEVDEDTFDAA